VAVKRIGIQFNSNDVPKEKQIKKQEHRSFIDWFIAVPAKITISRHQIELKIYEHHFYKFDW
jgi:hypothetical protein